MQGTPPPAPLPSGQKYTVRNFMIINYSGKMPCLLSKSLPFRLEFRARLGKPSVQPDPVRTAGGEYCLSVTETHNFLGSPCFHSRLQEILPHPIEMQLAMTYGYFMGY